MAHAKVYGVCGNKCAVEVSPKSEQWQLVETKTVTGGTDVTISFYRYKNLILVQTVGKWNASAYRNVQFPDNMPAAIAFFGNKSVSEISVNRNGRTLNLNGQNFNYLQLIFIVNDDPVNVTCDISSTSIKKNENLIIKAEANGGDFDYTYKFVAQNVATGEEIILQNWANISTFTWKPTTAGSYIIFVYAKDSKNVSATSEGKSITVI